MCRSFIDHHKIYALKIYRNSMFIVVDWSEKNINRYLQYDFQFQYIWIENI